MNLKEVCERKYGCVCLGCLEPIIDGNLVEPKIGCYYHTDCYKFTIKYIKNKDKLQTYIKPESAIDSEIYKTMKERIGPPDFKSHMLDIKTYSSKYSPNILQIDVLNKNCHITNLHLRLTNPNNNKLSELFSGIETQAGGCPTQQLIGDIESHFAVLSNFLDCGVSYEPGYINIKLGLFHNKMVYFLTPNWEFYINLKLIKQFDFYANIKWEVKADIYKNHYDKSAEISKSCVDSKSNSYDYPIYSFINPLVHTQTIKNNELKFNSRINCLYLTELPASINSITRIRLEMDGIEILDIEPTKLIKTNKSLGIDYPGILIVFNTNLFNNIDDLINLSYVKNFNIYIDWIDPTISSDNIVAHVLSTNILQILKSGYIQNKYYPEFGYFFK